MDCAVTAESTHQTVEAGGPWTVRRVLDWTVKHLKKHGSETPRLDAEILLAHSRGCQRIDLYVHFDEPLTEDERAMMRDLVQRRAQAEPVAYLVGHREFFGLDFRVTRDVFIPRPDTETLVMELLERAKPLEEPRILDVCTGSGCISVAAAVNLPAARIMAVELSEAALAIAQENAARHEVSERIRFLQGDLFAPFADDNRFDVIASNPPYIAESEIASLQADVRQHEPRLALDGGPAGLVIIRKLVEQGIERLVPGGSLLMEIGSEQAEAVTQLLQDHGGYTDIGVRNDLGGRARVVYARKSG